MSEVSRAIFLSYASQDAEAAAKICEALRAGGIEVWLDQSELRGGDAWDSSIRKQIKTCALFMPIISRNTRARDEGYFRLEWKLAVDRSHLMVADRPFLVPAVIDDTSDQDDKVPERFREVQWTRLPGGVTPAAFVERVQRLLAGEPTPSTKTAPAASREPSSAPTPKPAASWGPRAVLLATIAVSVLAIGYVAANRFLLSKHGADAAVAPESAVAGSPDAGFNPPPHSIAVLPFADMSEKKDQEYFSDGLTEELLNSLAAVDGLQVAARTSAFSFKGKDTDIGTIARKLNVGTVLEGSVRRSDHTVRITAQLISAVTGFHLWSKTYDRDLGDVLKLQTEIATSVASALKVTLLGDIAAKVELGGTGNPAAFDAYLRGAKAVGSFRDAKDLPAAIVAYTQAIDLDPHYALAFAARSMTFSGIASQSESEAVTREYYDNARTDALHALELTPDLAQAHLALAYVSELTLIFGQANVEFDRALTLAPGNAEILRRSGPFAAYMGRFEAGIAASRRSVVLDPLARQSHIALAQVLYAARRYEESEATFGEVNSLDPAYKEGYSQRGLAYYALGDFEHARVSCETTPDHWQGQQCLAMTYEKLGRHADAQAQLAKLKTLSDSAAYQYATIYAQWGQPAQALEWLETAWRLRDPGLEYLKTDPMIDPIRQEPRFKAIERELKFPD